MSESTMAEVYVRTKAGRIHRAVVLNDRGLTAEGCNLDDAPGEEELVDASVVEAADPGVLCRQASCFPEPAA